MSLEANPIIVGPRGRGAVAVDLLVALAGATAARAGRRGYAVRQTRGHEPLGD